MPGGSIDQQFLVHLLSLLPAFEVRFAMNYTELNCLNTRNSSKNEWILNRVAHKKSGTSMLYVGREIKQFQKQLAFIIAMKGGHGSGVQHNHSLQ